MVIVLGREQREEVVNRKDKRGHVAEEGTNTSMSEMHSNSECKALVIATVLFFYAASL